MAGKGISNPLFFIGIVEDILDNAFMGRVKVRAFGIHGEKSEVPTEDLPWATCISGNYDVNHQPPALNMFVFGMFLDGEEGQHPLVLGLVPGQYTKEHDPTKDGAGVIPPFAKTLLGWLGAPKNIGEVQKSNLVRAEDLGNSYIGPRDANSLQKQNIADSNDKWSEPPPAYAARYPFNKVIQTAGGHSIELDDTPSSERITITHSSGAYVEIDALGTIKERAQGDRYEINIGTKHESSGHSVVTINGNSHVYVKGNKTEEIMGNYKRIVHGENEITVGGQSYLNVGGHLFMRGASTKIEGNADRVTIFGKNEVQIEAEKQINNVSGHIKNTAMLTFSAYANKAVRLTTPADMHFVASNIINTANGLIPSTPLTGGVGLPGFSINASAVHIGGYSTGTVPAVIPTVVGINGLVNATTGNFNIMTATTGNITTLITTGISATTGVFGTASAAVLRAAAYTGPIGSSPAEVLPPAISIPTIPAITLPAISIFAPSIAQGTVSGIAYPQGNGAGFAATVLTSPFSVLGFDINILPEGGLGIPRIEMPQPTSHGCSIVPGGYFALGYALGICQSMESEI